MNIKFKRRNKHSGQEKPIQEQPVQEQSIQEQPVQEQAVQEQPAQEQAGQAETEGIQNTTQDTVQNATQDTAEKEKPEEAGKTINAGVIESDVLHKKSMVQNILHWAGMVLFCVLSFFAVLLSCTAGWALSTFADLSMDEMVFELNAPITGTASDVMQGFIFRALIPAVISGLLAVLIIFLFRKKTWKRRLIKIGCLAFVAASVISVLYFGNRVNLWAYLKNSGTSSDFIEENYVDPDNVKITFPSKKRNLIYIYLESMECSYSDKEDGGALEDNLIPELTQLAQENEDFSGSSDQLNGGYAMPGTTFTMGAMFARTSGLPLKLSIEANSMNLRSSFFPSLDTLGDILEGEGYKQVLMIGSDAEFGGRGLYFTDHGDYELDDYQYALKENWIPSDYKVWWGYEDEKLFTFAKTKLQELGQGDEPFNFTMLTVDTHTPDGYRCELCGDEYNSNYENVIACSDKQVAEFVRWIQQQDFYDNTSIVITGDHPSMDAGIKKYISNSYVRKTYTDYINSAVKPVEPEAARKFSTFDDFPTTLAAMGVTIEGDRLGLGTNLFSKRRTLSERYGYEKEKSELSRKSDFLSSLENLGGNTDEKAADYAEMEIAGYNIDHLNKTLTITTASLSQDNDIMERVRVQVWPSKDSSEAQQLMAEKNQDGTWSVTMDISEYQAGDSVSILIFADTDLGSLEYGKQFQITV